MTVVDGGEARAKTDRGSQEVRGKRSKRGTVVDGGDRVIKG
jgi:hypothetical protein